MFRDSRGWLLNIVIATRAITRTRTTIIITIISLLLLLLLLLLLTIIITQARSTNNTDTNNKLVSELPDERLACSGGRRWTRGGAPVTVTITSTAIVD